MTAAPPYFTQFLPPHYRLTQPDRELSEADFELVAITVEDYHHVTRPMTEELACVPAEIRARATILRRLLSDHDIFRAGKVLKPESELRVRARMLDFTPIHPAFLLSCGNYPWVDDRLAGISMSFSMKGVPPVKGTPWRYRDDADVSLTDIWTASPSRWWVLLYAAGRSSNMLVTRNRRMSPANASIIANRHSTGSGQF